MDMFFEEVKNNCGFTALKWLMCDTSSQFYDTFALVNELFPMPFIFRWYVGKAWHQKKCNLLKSKVKFIAI